MGIELEVASAKVDRFGWDRMAPELRTRLRQDWMDALQDFTIGEVMAATREALANNPRDAVNEERIKALILSARAKRLAAIPKPPAPDLIDRRPDAETRARQAAELLGVAKRMNAKEDE